MREDGCRRRHHRRLQDLSGRYTFAEGEGQTHPEAVAPVVRAQAKRGDFVIYLGAGNITQWANALPGELASAEKAA